MSVELHTDVLIAGAGLSGLLAARRLAEHGLAAVVIEKEAVVGGRLATVRMGTGYADHGAQFFTVRSPEFGVWVERWKQTGLVFQWGNGWNFGSLDSALPDGHPRYVVAGGMQALAEVLAEGLDVRTGAGLVAVEVGEGGLWLAYDAGGRVYTANALLLTLPAPLALRLLDAGEVALAHSDEDALRDISFAPCVSAVFWVDGPIRLPEPGGVQRPNAPIAWIADNRRKGLSPDAALITVQAGPLYSEELWHLPDWEVLTALESGLHLFRDVRAAVVQSYLQRWLYARVVQTYPAAFLLAKNLPPLAFAGDAFAGPRVEGAALSGLAAADALAVRLLYKRG